MKLLCLSNGHGEDEIAVKILHQLHRQAPHIPIAALPLVGEGLAYQREGLPIVGPTQKMPSGGFVRMEGKHLWRDLKGGLLGLTSKQIGTVKKWPGFVLAVGDIMPLTMAWWSGRNYAFVGTAKSEYYLQDEIGWLETTSSWEKWLGSIYYPWERWLMQSKRCKAVYPRDTITHNVLTQFKIPSWDLGNPMMDDLDLAQSQPLFRATKEQTQDENLVVLLLPGSRTPEAYENWETIICGGMNLINNFRHISLTFLAAIAPGVDLEPMVKILTGQGWYEKVLNNEHIPIDDDQALIFTQKNATLVLTQQNYHRCLLASDLAIATAGTATEQFVGLGKPVITIPGYGPQFTRSFAEAQARLLGPSVIMVKYPSEVAQTIQELFQDPDRLQIINENGVNRLGPSGAGARIAHHLQRIISP